MRHAPEPARARRAGGVGIFPEEYYPHEALTWDSRRPNIRQPCFAGKHVVRRDDLHPAQLAILQGIADGKGYRAISEELDHPLSYVRYMTSAGPSGIDVRMDVPNIDAAMALALTLGWID